MYIYKIPLPVLLQDVTASSRDLEKKIMPTRRTTPLKQPAIESHECTADVRIGKLRLVPFFQHVNEAAIQHINSLCSARHFETDSLVYQQEEQAISVRIVVYGAVRLIHHTEEGKDILIDILQPGEYFGTLPVLGDDRYTESSYAHTNCCVLTIDEKSFTSILHKHHDIAVKLIGINARRLKKARETIRHLATSSAEQRIVMALRTLAEKFGEHKKNEILIQLPLSRKNLADSTGTTTETASRVMSQLQENNIIKTGRKWVSIIDQEALKRI